MTIIVVMIMLPGIGRWGAFRLTSARGQARKARMEKFELDEGFQPYHPPFRGVAAWPECVAE